ncbi:MAG: hypothetical protein KKA79_10655 [Nanoarchaeota archaeon]|nr:hypothetical protein [Nanoarchaeota archaeon]
MKILITTFGRDEAKLNVARRDIGYEKLVIITDAPELDAFKKIREMESITGTEVELIKVDSYDFMGCFNKIGETIEKYKNHDVRFNTSGGPKILSAAALLMCFNKGIPAYHSEEKTYKLPVIKGVSFEEKINRDERKILKNIKKECEAEKIKKKTGFSGRKFDILLMEMSRKGIAKMDYNGKTRIMLTPIGEYFRKKM